MGDPTLGEFRAEVGAFLAAHLKPRPADRGFAWGVGSDRVSLFDEADPDREQADLEEGRWWRRLVYDAGFGWISGPREYGGGGRPPAFEKAYFELERRFVTPTKVPFNPGIGFLAPTILAHGPEELKQRFLRAIYRGDIIACQLFSEPGAGSDLPSVATRAERDGDGWIVNGQKVWTSGAHLSDIGVLLARTAPGPRYRNLTAFVIDLRASGVEVRPLRQMTGGAAFCEVFLTDVRVPDSNRLGEPGDGWGVAMTTLMNERSSFGGSGTGGTGLLSLGRYTALLQHLGLDQDPVARQELADLHIRLSVARLTIARAQARLRAGQPPGPEMSITKLVFTNNLQAISRTVSRWLGPSLAADTGQWGTYAWNDVVLGTPGLRLGGGTDEIQRNILAERVLGLPKDPTAQ